MDQRTEESVWDYPRPPRVEPTSRHLKVFFNGVLIAETQHALRALETSHPPVYYFPPEDVQMAYLKISDRRTFCEYKGVATYYTVKVGEKSVKNAAWYYAAPHENYSIMRGHIGFYANLMEACYVDDEPVLAQESDYYGGWITASVKGPFRSGVTSRSTD